MDSVSFSQLGIVLRELGFIDCFTGEAIEKGLGNGENDIFSSPCRA